MSRSDSARVHVYWNRTLRIWSVRRGGKVVDRRPTLALHDCILHVGESARLRILRTQERDVHAWVNGILTVAERPPGAVRVGYRPSEAGFRRRDTGEVLTSAALVLFEVDGSCWASL